MSISKKSIAIVLVFILLLFPFVEVIVVPNWRLQVVNEKGVSLSDELMIQGWRDYSIEFWFSDTHTEKKSTDKNGYVNFPERTIRVSIAQLALSELWDFTSKEIPHTSQGKHSYIVCAKIVKCQASYSEGDELPKVIIVEE